MFGISLFLLLSLQTRLWHGLYNIHHKKLIQALIILSGWLWEKQHSLQRAEVERLSNLQSILQWRRIQNTWRSNDGCLCDWQVHFFHCGWTNGRNNTMIKVGFSPCKGRSRSYDLDLRREYLILAIDLVSKVTHVFGGVNTYATVVKVLGLYFLLSRPEGNAIVSLFDER